MKTKIFYKLMFCAFIIALFSSLSYGAVITVSKTGSADFTAIQAALDAATSSPGTTIQVLDNTTYAENLSFTTSSLTLKAAPGVIPTIAAVGDPAPKNNFISLQKSGDEIDGFIIQHSGAVPVAKSLLIVGGANAAVKNCRLLGDNTVFIRGIGNTPTVSNVEITGLGIALLYDGGVTATISNAYVHDSPASSDGYGVSYSGATAVNDLTVLNSTFSNLYRSVNGNSAGSNGLLKNCAFLNSGSGRTSQLTTIGNLYFEDCVIYGSSTDLILENGAGTKRLVDFKRCIFAGSSAGGACINSSGTNTTTINVDHCDLVGSSGQFAIFTINPLASIAIQNSIITGVNALNNNGGTSVMTSINDDVYVTGTRYNNVSSSDYNLKVVYVKSALADINDPEFFTYSNTWGLGNLATDNSFLGSRGPIATAARDWELYN